MTLQKPAPTSLTTCALILPALAMLWGMTAHSLAQTEPGQTSPLVTATSPQTPKAAATNDPATNNDKPAKTDPVKVAPKRPTVIEVFPPSGTEEVDPVTEVRVRFDQPMDPDNTDLRWDQAFFTPRGIWRYDSARHEFIFPVELKPFELQRVSLNSSLKSRPKRGFRSAAGQMALPYTWTFHTRRDVDEKGAPLPRVIDIYPPSNSEIGRLVKIGIVFDQPMLPTHFHQVIADEEGKEPISIPFFHLNYSEKENRFDIPIELPPNWSGLLKFAGFRSELNRHVLTFQAQYTVGDQMLTQAHKEQLGQASQSRDLMILLQDMAQARRNLKTLSETSRTTQYAIGENGIFTTMRSAGAEFHMDGPKKFYADVTDMVEYPFIIASDGNTCWWYTQDEEGKQLAQIPYIHLDHINLVIGDPFALSRIPPSQAIVRMNLEYLGVEKLEGQDCFVIQAWNLNENSPRAYPHPNITRVWIDPTNYLPRQSIREWGTALRVVHKFTYQQINQPIADSQFAMPQGPDIRKRPLKALGDGYEFRYINVGDPSSGVMSVEWGRYGTAGQDGIGIK